MYAAAGIVAVLAAPYLVWQATHGFPQLSVASSITGGDSPYSGRLDAALLQLVIISPYAVPIWFAGLVALLSRPAWRAYRTIGWAWLVVFAVVLLAGGKGYYDAPLLLVLTAASAGPAFAVSLAAIHCGLPPEQRQRAVILTGNYGEAGAVARYGPERSLPRAYSGHNSMAGFGRPPESTDVVIAVGWARSDQLRDARHVTAGLTTGGCRVCPTPPARWDGGVSGQVAGMGIRRNLTKPSQDHHLVNVQG